jgi:hypothetical protein
MRSEYITFGGLPQAQAIDVDTTRQYLESLGYGDGDLAQARNAIEAREDKTFTMDGFEGRHCDFCFSPIIGSDFERLSDGRDRCSRCSRTVIKSHEQFVDEYQQVRQNMEAAFGIKLDVPSRVRMANAKEIQGKTNESFTPTPGVDPRVLGFVAKSSSGQELWIENGSPRLAAITTMAHELTHVWQNSTWDESTIQKKYGKKNELIVYEGMATWTQIQYLLFTRENSFAEWQHAYAMQREDAYGVGYKIFLQRYSLTFTGDVDEDSPFRNSMPL